MKRFGVIFISSSSEGQHVQTTPHLYRNMIECLSFAHRNTGVNTPCIKPRFFKLLNNKQILNFIIDDQEDVDREYGFLHLNKELDVVRCSSQTHSCLLEIIKQASEIHTPSETIGYFKLLCENEIVKEMHVKY